MCLGFNRHNIYCPWLIFLHPKLSTSSIPKYLRFTDDLIGWKNIQMLVCLHHLLLRFQKVKWLGKQSCFFGPNSDVAGEKKINQKLILHLSNNTSIYIQFSSVQSLSCVRLFATPWIAAHQASLSITKSWSSLKLTLSQWCLQPSHSLSSTSPPAPNPSQHQSLFQQVNSSHEVAKVLEFQL